MSGSRPGSPSPARGRRGRGWRGAESDAAKREVRGAYDLAASRYERYIMPTFVPIGRRILWYARPNTDDLHVDLATGTGLVPALADDRRMMTCIPPWRVAMDFSASMLQELCDAVLAGHSERRVLYGETSELVGAKVAAIAATGMRPFLCVGEQLAERQAGRAEAVVAGQLAAGVSNLESTAVELLVVAYEPVWAIGTGVAATGSGGTSVSLDKLRRFASQ